MSTWSLSRWGHGAQAINKVEGLKSRTQEAVKNLLFLCSLLPKSLRGQQTVQPPAHPDEPRLLRGSDYQLRSKSAQQTWDTLKIRVEKTFYSAPNARSAPWFFYTAGICFCRQIPIERPQFWEHNREKLHYVCEKFECSWGGKGRETRRRVDLFNRDWNGFRKLQGSEINSCSPIPNKEMRFGSSCTLRFIWMFNRDGNDSLWCGAQSRNFCFHLVFQRAHCDLWKKK